MEDSLNSNQDKFIGQRLKDLREERGWSQAEVVSRMRQRGIAYINTSTLSRIESGTRPVRLTEAKGFSYVFGVSMHYLIAAADTLMRVTTRFRIGREAQAQFKTMLAKAVGEQGRLQSMRASVERLAADGDSELAREARMTLNLLDDFVRFDFLKEAEDVIKSAQSPHGVWAAIADRTEVHEGGENGEHQAEA